MNTKIYTDRRNILVKDMLDKGFREYFLDQENERRKQLKVHETVITELNNHTSNMEIDIKSTLQSIKTLLLERK